MKEHYSTKFCIKVSNNFIEGAWSFGVGLAHFLKETYLYINLFNKSISIGFLYEEEEVFIDNF